MICLTPKLSQSFFVYCIQSKENFFTEKELFKEKGSGGLNEKKTKRRLFNCSCYGHLEGPHMTIRKHANELKVHMKTVRTAIKQDLSPDSKPLDYAICGVLKRQNKCNFTSKHWFA